MGLLDGRVAIVTGSGRGIGREFALCFASEGASVVVNDVGVSLDGRGTEEDPAAQVCKEIEAAGGHAVPNYDSVTDFDGARSIVQTAVDAFGTVDILVNNAGIVRDRTLLKMDESDFDAVVAVHLKGTFNCTRHAARGDEGQGLRPDHQHHVVGRAARQLRPDELRRGQGRHHGHDVRVVDGARPLRHHRERGRAVGRDAHDRRAVRALGPGAAARGEPGARTRRCSRSSRRSRPAT